MEDSKILAHGSTNMSLGWKVVLSPQVPKLTGSAMAPAFKDLLASVPTLPADYQKADDFDWAMHPGGATILSGAERILKISSEHMRASYDTYMKHGNSSSATVYSVLNRLRSKDMDSLAPGGRVREYVVGCAFGPGISVEMCMMRRNMAHGSQITGLPTPPETESEPSEPSEPSETGDTSDSSEVEWANGRTGAPAGTGSERVDPKTWVAEALEKLDLD